MKALFYLGGILLLTTQVNAETYSWVDDSGTYNFTEDFSSVPKKYQKKVKRREDLHQDVKPSVSPDIEKVPSKPEKLDAKSPVASGEEKELYGGKSRETWRKELKDLEAELRQIEQHMEQLKSQVNNSMAMPVIQYNLLKKDFDNLQATYDQKYKNYTELIETIRKYGLVVEIKK